MEDGRGTCSGLPILAVFCRFGPPSGVGLSSGENGKMAKPCCVVVLSAAALGGDGDAHCSAACSERCLIQTTVPVALLLLTVH